MSNTLFTHFESLTESIQLLPSICESLNSSIQSNPQQITFVTFMPFYLAGFCNFALAIIPLYHFYAKFKCNNLTHIDLLKLNEAVCYFLAAVICCIIGCIFFRDKIVCPILSVALWYIFIVACTLMVISGICINLRLSGNYFFNTRQNWTNNLRKSLLFAYLFPVVVILPLVSCVMVFPQFSGNNWIFVGPIILPMLIHTLNCIRIIFIYNKLEDRQASLSFSNARQTYKWIWYFGFFFSCVCPWWLSMFVLLTSYQVIKLFGYFVFYLCALLQIVVYRNNFFFKPSPSDVTRWRSFIRDKLYIKCVKNDIFVRMFTEDEIGADEEYGENVGDDADTYSTASVISISYISTGAQQNTNNDETQMY